MGEIWQKLKHLNRQRNYKTKKIKNTFKMNLMYLLKKNKNTIFEPNKYQNILIFMHSLGIGDVIVASGFIDILKKNNKKVSIVAEKKILFLFEELIPVDEYFEFESSNFSKFKKSIDNKNFDLIVDFSDIDTTIIRRFRSLLVINHKHSLSFNQPKKSLFDTKIDFLEDKHISERKLLVLKLLGIEVNDYKYVLNIPSNIKDHVDNYIFSKIKPSKLIIFNPFASLARRSMGNEQIQSLLMFFEQLTDYKTIVFDCNNLIDCSKYNNVIANPYSSFIESAYLVECCDFVVSVDTSIVHLAQAFDKHLLAIYNNRLFNNKFSNNIVWGPNYDKAMQITTTDYLNTEEGDSISRMDVTLITDSLLILLENS